MMQLNIPLRYARFYSALLFIFICYIICQAWVTEDAFITFRVIDNFINGYGLRWNIDERVQVYTHPLWLFLETIPYFLSKNIIFSAIAPSLILSTFSISILFYLFKEKPLIVIGAIFLPLILSSSFIEFTSSGLENPLTIFLLALFLVELNNENPSWLWLSTIAALAGINRLDTLLLYAPALALLGLYDFRNLKFRQIFFGFLPLFLWLLFSLFYYGFLFPNTKYAKLNSGLGLWYFIHHGLLYLFDFLMNDPLSFALVMTGIFSKPFFAYKTFVEKKQNYLKPLGISGGIGLYSLYIIIIGGDFMSGRFFSAPIFLSVYLVAFLLAGKNKKTILIAACLIVFSFLPSFYLKDFYRTKLCEGKYCGFGPYGILTERNVFKKTNGLFSEFSYAGHGFYKECLPYRNEQGGGNIVKEATAIGMCGIAAGANVILIDKLALSDPLLSRLKVSEKEPRIGHFKRAVPKEYIEARKSGDIAAMKSPLGKYYKPLRLITSGSLFDEKRLEAIWDFNLGRYDGYRDSYEKIQENRALQP